MHQPCSRNWIMHQSITAADASVSCSCRCISQYQLQKDIGKSSWICVNVKEVRTRWHQNWVSDDCDTLAAYEMNYTWRRSCRRLDLHGTAAHIHIYIYILIKQSEAGESAPWNWRRQPHQLCRRQEMMTSNPSGQLTLFPEAASSMHNTIQKVNEETCGLKRAKYVL